MISKNIALKVLNTGLATGADFAEIYLEQIDSKILTLDNGLIDAASSTRTYGVGIRLLKGLQSVYGTTNNVSPKSLINLAGSLAKSFKDKKEIEVTGFKTIHVKQRQKFVKCINDVDTNVKTDLLKKCYEVIKNYDQRIIRVQCSFASNKKNFIIFNSNGKIIKDERQYGRLGLQAVAQDNGQIEAQFNAPGCQAGYEYFEQLDVEKLALETAKNTILMLEAKECPSGRMPVVIGNGFGGVLFHEACGHALEASSVSKKLSVFSDSLGKQIASPLVTALDDATIPNGWGSINVDDEGNPGEKTVLIENGVLKNYMIDDFNGRRMNEKGNGSCRRQNYNYEPTSRMTNTYIANGTSKVADIISNTKLGLYAKELGGGSVNPTTGEFNFSCSVAYMIRDGKIAEPVRGATLIGSGAEILKKIDMIADDLKTAEGMCGASSGSIPTSVGQPTLRVSEITVGGRGGNINENK